MMMSLNTEFVPKVSVIMPVYNAEIYLRECLDSIVNQTLKEIEIICIDDGSTDNSLDILLEYAKKDHRFHIVKQNNQGAAVARNYGLNISRGAYLAFLDSDDYFDLKLLEKTYIKAVTNDADIVIFKAESFNTKNYKKTQMNDAINKFGQYFDKCFSVKDVPDDIFNSFLIPAWNKLFRRKFVVYQKILFQNIKRSNDLYFTSKALVLAEKIILLNDTLINYRVGMQNNLQAGNDKTPLAFYQALMELKSLLSDTGIFKTVEKSYVKLVFEVIFYNLNTLKTDQARNSVIQKLKSEGFKELGILASMKLKELSWIEALQYSVFQMTNNKCINCSLYKLYKLWQYLRLTGIKNTYRKILWKC